VAGSGFRTCIASGFCYLAVHYPRATFCQASPESHSARGCVITLLQSVYLFGSILEYRSKNAIFYNLSLVAEAPDGVFPSWGWSREISTLWASTGFGRCLDFVPKKHGNSATSDKGFYGQSRRFTFDADATPATAPLEALKSWYPVSITIFL
jgi:hypothetical protein